MKRVLVIRADCAPHIGAGHVIRGLALGEWARRSGEEVHFISRAALPWVRELLIASGFRLTLLDGVPPQKESPSELPQMLRGVPAGSWVTLDGYHFDCDFQKAVRLAGCRLCCVDDYAHLPEYHCDILLNQNPDAEALPYRGKFPVFLAGPRYALLRPEFPSVRSTTPPPATSSNPRDILFSLGGGDFSQFLPEIAPLFQNDSMKNRCLHVLAGGMKNENLEQAFKGSPARLNILRVVTDMPALLLQTDVCISAGGSTCWELCCLGIPFVTVEVAPNQHGIVTALDNMAIASPCTADSVHELLFDATARANKRFLMQQLVDGLGASRVLHAMQEQ